MRPLKQRWMGADLDRLKCSFKKFAMDSVASNAMGTGEADALTSRLKREHASVSPMKG